MSSPSSATFESAGWSARNSSGGQRGMEAPRTAERKRRGRGVDVMTLPTPPHSRVNTQLPTPETVRQPRKSAPRSKDAAAVQPSVSFLPTPQTLPRKRTSLEGSSSAARAPSPSGQTTFIHSATSAEPPAALPRRRPGLTFAQQMGLLTTTAAPTGFGGRLGVGVGMGGGHKSSVYKTVDMIPRKIGEREEENPFYVSPTTRPKKAASPRTVLRSSTKAMLEEDLTDDEEEMAGPSSPLAGRSPLFPSVHPTSSAKRAKLTPPSRAPPIPSTPSRHTLAPAPHFPQSPTATRRSPRQLAKSAKLSAMLDAEHNPFLSRPTDVHAPQPPPGGVDESDRPYVTYVFRGSKKVFANPFTRPDLPFPPAQLRPEDPEFEEHPCPKPRLLWPSKPADEEEATPSPPSSPIRTPRTNRKSRFVASDRSLDGGMFNPPREVYSDSEEEREVTRRRVAKRAERAVDSDEEEAVPAPRRGLLFGPPAVGSGSAGKRAGEEAVGRDGKKAKTLRM